MCSSDHFFTGNNNHAHFQPNQHSFSPAMETSDLDRHGGAGGDQDRSLDPRAVLTTYLTFLEHKIGHLRGILCTTPSPRQQHAIVSAELRCIIVQLVSIADDLASSRTAGEEADHAGSPPLSNSTHDDSDHAAEEAEAARDETEHPPTGPYEVVQIEKEDILAPHAHACKVCGKGFKRDANLRMHMRGHGDQYKTATALAKPSGPSSPLPETNRRFYYSCPYTGCKRNKEHRDFQPLKNPVCVKNHYRRSHCDKSHLCRRCGVKRFSVLADLRTHEKHCGRDKWVCSCGVTFSRKEKLFAHVAVFDGHTAALPPPDDDADTNNTSVLYGSGEQPLASGEALNVGNMVSDYRCSGGNASLDDLRRQLPSFCDFEGFDLLDAVAMDF